MKTNLASMHHCNDYEIANVQQAVDECIKDLGGIEKFVKPNQTVVLKANLLDKHSPDKAVTTHPSVVQAVANRVIQAGAKCIIADSPAVFFNHKHVSKIYEVTGMAYAACQSGAILNDNFETVTVDVPKGEKLKKLEIIDVIDKADIVINLCKMKTHNLTGYTGAVKNFYGIIPGLIKTQTHSLFPKLKDFCNVLIDIEQLIEHKLALTIVDAVVGMEGPGPSGGTPRIINKIIASQSPFAADCVILKLMNLNPAEHPLMIEAKRRNLVDENCEVKVLGDDLEQSIIKDYGSIKVQAEGNSHVLPKWLQPAFKRHFQRTPVISKKSCKGCKKCSQHCPANAISMQYDKRGGQYAKIDYSKCISCFCCQELCPFNVVAVRTPLGYKMIQRKQLKRNKTLNSTKK